ncbi:MAG: hypothetical protein ACK5WZ_09315 [Pseudobdellovibrionaceae bacterium]
MKFVFLSLVLFLFGSIIWGIFNLGVFKEVTFEQTDVAEPVTFHLLAISKTGAYHEINSVLVDLETWAASKKINCRQTFGLFYDDPDLVEESRLRADVGCVIVPEELNEISKHTSDPELKKYKARRLILKTDSSQILTAVFSGSPWLGPLKVYSGARKRFHELQTDFQFPVLETYNIADKNPHTHYIFFLKQVQISPVLDMIQGN